MPRTREVSSVRIGVSACLLGKNVRFDGGHARDRFVTDRLAGVAELVPICPEMELGLGAPRPAIRLERHGGLVRLTMPKSDRDLTSEMETYAARRVDAIGELHLSGYILKKDSPSCGVDRVKVYDANGVPSRTGRGLFARELIERWPLLPIEGEGRLHDTRLRENFFERTFAYRRLHDLFDRPWSLGGVVAFHAREKLLLLSHDPTRYKELGQLVAEAAGRVPSEFATAYQSAFMAALARPASVSRQQNALQRILGFFKDRLEPAEKRELLDLVEDYRCGLRPWRRP